LALEFSQSAFAPRDGGHESSTDRRRSNQAAKERQKKVNMGRQLHRNHTHRTQAFPNLRLNVSAVVLGRDKQILTFETALLDCLTNIAFVGVPCGWIGGKSQGPKGRVEGGDTDRAQCRYGGTHSRWLGQRTPSPLFS
jgi:hypothetical protein